MRIWGVWFVFGVLAIVGGGLAIANPFAAAVTVEQMTAMFFLLSGFAWIGSSLFAPKWSAKLISVLVGAIIVWIGFILLANPIAGIFSIALTIGASLIILGAFKFSVAISGRKEKYFWPVLSSSLVSVLFGILILLGVSPIATLAALLAVQLVSIGVSMIGVALWARNAPNFSHLN